MQLYNLTAATMDSFTSFAIRSAVEFIAVQTIYTGLCVTLEYINPALKTTDRKKLFFKQYKHSFWGVLAGTLCQRVWIVFIDPLTRWNEYFETNAYTAKWALLNISFFIFVYETMFYWIHRLLHIKKPINLYRMFHKEHHYFETTTAAAAAVNPIEIAILSVGLNIPKLFLPYSTSVHHILVSLVFLESIFAHDSQFDVFNHGIHHTKQNYHYGFALPFWDWIMGTTYRDKLNKSIF